jgi:DNA-directed RNA polymerase specialized sigma24 family protein
VEDPPKPWWATDPELAEVLRKSQEEFERELEARAPDPDAPAVRDLPDPVLNDMLNGTSKRALAAARDDLARARSRYDEAVLAGRTAGLSWGEMAAILGVSRQTLHRRFARGRV